MLRERSLQELETSGKSEERIIEGGLVCHWFFEPAELKGKRREHEQIQGG